MQDISRLPPFEIQTYLTALKDKPIDEKAMKLKVDKIYSMTTYTESEYMPDVIQCYAWLLIVNRHLPLKEVFPTDKLQKYFCEEFLINSVKYLILCKRFHMIEMMTLTQQYLVQSLLFFKAQFDQLERFPKLTHLPKLVLEIQRQFYKLNYITEFPHLLVQPSKEQLQQNFRFVQQLKEGDVVDALKMEHYGRRLNWSRARITKVGYASVGVEFLYQKSSFDRNIQKKAYQIAPLATYTHTNFEWRLLLKKGDEVDYQVASGNWVRVKIEEVRESDDVERKYLEVRFEKYKEQDQHYGNEWVCATSNKIQKLHTFSTVSSGKKTFNHQIFLDDYNDDILDPDNTAPNCIIRSDYTKSILFVQLANYADQIGLFSMILKTLEEGKVNLEVCAQLIGLVHSVHVVFKRRFAIHYLGQLSNALLSYIRNSDQSNIRNFSKQRLEIVIVGLNDFYKRITNANQRKNVMEQLHLELTLRFINSDFLERKMQAVATITEYIRMCKHNFYKITYQEFVQWIAKHDIIKKIFNEKSHSELISRATDFLKIYLSEQPDIQSLEPFLEHTQPILKTVNELYELFPKQFKVLLVDKITSKKNVSSKDALEIIKKSGANEVWLLQNGGDGWVDVIKSKKKRAHDIQEVFNQKFDIVYKITKEVDQCNDARLKNEFFEALEKTNYLTKSLDMNIEFNLKIELAFVIVENMLSIGQTLFGRFCELWDQHCSNSEPSFYSFYQMFLSRLHKEQLRIFFDKFFTTVPLIKRINDGSFCIFKSCFTRINQSYLYIQKKYVITYAENNPLKKQKKQTTTITVNPNKLIGMTQLMNIIFENQQLSVIQSTLEFISYLFDHLAKNLLSSVKEFKQNFLQQCLEKLYESTSYEKYLKIIGNILNESEKEGNGGLESVAGLMPSQKMKILVIDCFNASKVKINFQVSSNLTIYELRFYVGKRLSAYVHEMNIIIDGKLLDERFNGYTVRQLDIKHPLTIEKKVKIDRATLIQSGKLTAEARRIFERVFKQNSTDGLMSKSECQKYHQKCVGDYTTVGEAKVQKIYQTYDSDKDGFLTVEDFIKFYENSIKLRESTVWSNLQMLGIRNDLKILDDLTITHVDYKNLNRYLLLKNSKFMTLLFKILDSDEQSNRKAAWGLLSRLPLFTESTYEFNLENPYALRYWLIVIDSLQEYQRVNSAVVERILQSDDETLAIGLKVASHLHQLDLKIFVQLINKLQQLNNNTKQLNYFDKTILHYSLGIIVNGIKGENTIQQDYIANSGNYESVFLGGLMSLNQQVRETYANACYDILQNTIQIAFGIFHKMFQLIYKNFENCNKQNLHPEYFELFSKMLQMLHTHPEALQKLALNWTILSKSMIDLFKSHKCTEERLSSAPDWVAQGFMKILSKLLDADTVDYFIDLVPFLFQNLLFPEGGLNKLKNAKTRKQAYELLYAICASGVNKQGLSGLQLLFDSGFRKIYKSMSNTKTQVFSYFGSYNQIRSELGYAGIRNLGCICYMIAMLQQFYMTRPFRYLVLMADDNEPECLVKRGNKQIDDNVLHQLQNMFAHLELTERQEYNPDQFCFSFKDFEGNPVNVSIQQDAQQFLNMIFDKIERGIKNTPFKRLLENVYGGKSCTQLICTSCNAVKQRDQTFYNLSLEVKGFKNIDESFKKFISGETISDYKCDSCNKKTDTIKKCLVSQLPNYFIIHLQRICFNYDKFENEKVNTRWEFPHTLNVYDYTIQKEKKTCKNSEQFEFQLKGIVVHIGSAEYGHYFSYINTDSQWLEFNDERVREFDPKDIETECFGGEHWRRQNQSAYLLVYEKKHKSSIKLEFENVAQQQALTKSLKLEHLEIVKPQIKPIIQKEQDKEEVIVEKQPQSIVALLDIHKVPAYISDRLLTKINKSNQDFSMNLNVSNTQFAHFVYRILSINPPKSLKAEYLQLCYECFHFKNLHLENTDLSVSDWMAKRFRQLIVGSGWEFFNNSIGNWEKQILSHERSSRISIKNLLISVISDVITTYQFAEQDTEQSAKISKVVDFLDKYLDMLNNEIPKNWMRFQEYFEFWIELLKESQWLRKYAYSRNMISKLFDFILQNDSPIKPKDKKYPGMGSKITSPQFEFPIQIISLLSKSPYTLNTIEKTCLNHYSFLEKLTRHHTKESKIIQLACRDNILNSERFAYMILYNASKVTHSDDIKPIIESIHQFLDIDDTLKKNRLEWILGYPQLIYHPRTNSFGLYGIHSILESIYQFKSALRYDPILQLVVNIKDRYEHVAALLVSMLLQIEKDGHTILTQYPSHSILNEDYTSWLPTFVQSYYEDTRKMYPGSNYLGYGDRIKELWTNRKQVPKDYHNWVIGKTISTKTINHIKFEEILDIKEVEYTCALIKSKASFKKNDSIPSQVIYPRTGTITSDGKILKKYKNFQIFLSKTPVATIASAATHDEQTGSEDESTALLTENPFGEYQTFNYIKLITFRNISLASRIIIVKLISDSTNIRIPCTEISFTLDPEKEEVFTIHKIRPHDEWGNLSYQIRTFETKMRDLTDDWPKQILTPSEDNACLEISSDEDDFTY